MKRLVAAAFVVFAVALPRAGRADEPEVRVDNRARAQELFDSALADAQAGDFASACPKFLASQEADPKTSTLLNLANCYERNGQTASAWGAFREAEVLARKASRTEWEESARTRAEALEPKLVRLTIVVPPESRVEGLVVVRDGVRIPLGEWGVAIPVDPGAHVVTASADKRESFAEHVEIEGESKSVAIPVLTPVAEPPPPPPPRPPAEPAPPPPRASGWSTLETTGAIAAGVGAVGLVTGTVLGVVANGSYSDARAQCSDAPRGCPGSAVSDADSAYGLAAGATVTFVVSAVVLAGCGALFFFAPKASTSGKAGSRGVAVAPNGLVGRW